LKEKKGGKIMISKSILKDIIISNEEFITQNIKQIVKRENLSFPEKLKKAVILYGVRRSGKTHILFDLFKKHKDCSLYLDFEDERLTDFEVKDFEGLKDIFLELKPELIDKELIFLFDEIQNIEGWEKYCRRIVEREKIKVFLTGSSSRIMPMEIHTSLRGRAWSIEITPFSFWEYLHLKGINTKDKKIIYGSKKALIKKHFAEYLKWGGFPEVSLLKSDFEKRKVIKEYLEAMFFKDLVERFNMTNTHLLKVLTEKLFSSFSTKFSLTAFYKQYHQKFPFSKDTLFSYYHYFLESMLIFEIKKFSESSYKRLRNPAKIYLADTGICKKVTSADWGRILENIVFLELRRKGDEIYYFAEKRECDFIVKNNQGKLFPYQVTLELKENNREREITGLTEACKRLKIKEGTIFTYDEEDNVVVEGIHIKIIPVWKWLLNSK
jgi:predicted AAA+ superfamily ATPase